MRQLQISTKPSEPLPPQRRKRAAWRRAGRPSSTSPGWQQAEAGALAAIELEAALAAELGLAQRIAALAEQERLRLVQDNPAALAEAVYAKTGCMERLIVLQAASDSAAAQWAREAGLPECLALPQVLGHYDQLASGHLSAYYQGIVAHLEYARSFGSGNRALARSAAGRHESWRHLLTDHFAQGLWAFSKLRTAEAAK